jgi:hypothetical protein
MMSCPACTEAKVNRWCGAYRADCIECSARALSHSPAYWESLRAGQPGYAYKEALVITFGDNWRAGHLMVKAWADARATATTEGAPCPTDKP